MSIVLVDLTGIIGETPFTDNALNWGRPFGLEGQPGRMRKVERATAIVMDLSVMNIHLQDSYPRALSRRVSNQTNSPEQALPSCVAENTKVLQTSRSDCLYQEEMRKS